MMTVNHARCGTKFQQPLLCGDRLWYNNSADAETKPAYAALQPGRADCTGNPWLENQMLLRSACFESFSLGFNYFHYTPCFGDHY